MQTSKGGMSQPARLGYRRWDKNHQEWGYNNDIMKKKIEIGHSVTEPTKMRIPGCVQNEGNTLLSLFDLTSMVHPSEPGSSEPHLVPGEKETPTSSIIKP